jgi:hypothetical protein
VTLQPTVRQSSDSEGAGVLGPGCRLAGEQANGRLPYRMAAYAASRWPNSFGSILGIVILGILCHGVLVFTDYLLWDGIWQAHILETAPDLYRVFERPWLEGGRWYETPYYWPLIGSPAARWYAKCVGCVSWIATSLGCFLSLRALPGFGRGSALAIASLMLSLPLYDVLGDLNSLLYSVPTMWFWAGVYLLQTRSASATLYAFTSRSIAALSLLFVSFFLPSNLVFFYGYFVFMVACEFLAGYFPSGLTIKSLALRVRRDIDALMLPLVFWVLKKTFFPTSGAYLSYNAIRLNFTEVYEVYSSVVFPLAIGEVLQVLSNSWVIPVSVAVGVVAVAALRRWNLCDVQPATGMSAQTLVIGGLWMALCAVFPYAAVGQPLSATGWLTRNAILLPLPFAMMIFAGIRWLFQRFLPSITGGVVFLTTAIVAIGTLQTNLGYLRLQALGAKQAAIEMNLEPEMQSRMPLSIVQIRDEFPIADTMPWYPPMIWSYLLAPGGHLPQTFVIDTRPFAADVQVRLADGSFAKQPPILEIGREQLEVLVEQTTGAHMLTGVPRDGRQIVAVVRPGEYGTDAVLIGLSYLWTMHFAPAELTRFLSHLVAIQIQEGPSVR